MPESMSSCGELTAPALMITSREALTRWVAKDVGQSGIYVNSVAPGGVETEMTRGYAYSAEDLPIPRMGQAEDVAEAVLFLASPASNYVTGQVLRVDGGWVLG